MRARFLDALVRPIEDIKVGLADVDRIRRPAFVLRKVESTLVMTERAFEVISLGLAVAEIHLAERELKEDEP